MKSYYMIEFMLNEKSYYCIWYTNDKDGFIVDNHKVKSFDDKIKLNKYCINNSIFLEKGKTTYNLDELNTWLNSDKKDIDSNILLSMWNIMSDFAFSIDNLFLGDKEKLFYIYDKLFYCNNLPAYKKNNKLYDPYWENQEIKVLSNILFRGLNLIKENLI